MTENKVERIPRCLQVWCYKLYRGLRKHSRAQQAQKAAKAV